MTRSYFHFGLLALAFGISLTIWSVRAQEAKPRIPPVPVGVDANIPPLRETIPTTLDVTSTTQLTVPSFGYSDEPQCDNEGDVFFHLFSGSYRSSAIFELMADPDKSLVYRLPPDLANTVSFESYSVTPSGVLYVLGQIRDGSEDKDVHEYVFDFSDSDGSMNSQTRLETPPYLLADGFAVLQSGTILFSGHFVKEAPAELRGRRYAALFSADGKLIQTLDAQGKIDATQLMSGAATRGADGDAYLLGSKDVLVISSTGEISRRIPFHSPDPTVVPTGIRISEGLMSITLSKVRKDGWIEPRYLVLDDYNGDFYGYYVPSKALGNELLCFSRRTGYTFLKTGDDDKTQEILRAQLR